MKPAVRYVIRAAKYFCWFAVLFVLIISVLIFTKFVPSDGGVEGLFINGWKSVLEIFAVFFIFSAIYPKLGYQKRTVQIPGEWDEVEDAVKGYFAGRDDYVLESESAGKICYRARRTAVRIARRWEDRLTVTQAFGGVEIEGPSKDVGRIVSHMEYSLRDPLSSPGGS